MEQTSGGPVLPEVSPLPPKKKRGRPRKSDSAPATPGQPVSSEKVRKNKENKKSIGAGGSKAKANLKLVKDDILDIQQTGDAAPTPSKPLVGHSVHGVVDGFFDSGYLITIRVNDTDIVFRGVVFGPGIPVDGDGNTMEEDGDEVCKTKKKRKSKAVNRSEDDDGAGGEEEEHDPGQGSPSLADHEVGDDYHSVGNSNSDTTAFAHHAVQNDTENAGASPAAPAAYRSSLIDPEMMRFMYPGGLPQEQPQYPSAAGSFYPFHLTTTAAGITAQAPTASNMQAPHPNST